MKVYLTADPSARAARRTAENGRARSRRPRPYLLRRDTDRLRPCRGAGRGRGRRTPRHDAVHAGAGDRPGRRAGRGRRAVARERRPPRRRRRAPSSDGVPSRARALLYRGRSRCPLAIRRRWRAPAARRGTCPRPAAVMMPANHVGWLDGPLLAICSPRPVHALTKEEMFEGPLGAFLHASGQIPLDRHHVDVRAIRSGGAHPRGRRRRGGLPRGGRGAGGADLASRRGAAYLALVTGDAGRPGLVPRHRGAGRP